MTQSPLTVTFQCGHQKQCDGSELALVCLCGETQIARVDAPAPVFVGTATGPHVEFMDLQATAVSFGVKSNG